MKWIILTALALLLAACDGQSDETYEAPDGGDDAGEDAGTDTDVDSDTDSDTDTGNTCPLNSTEHCACDTPGELCEDGETLCTVIPYLDTELGVCVHWTPTGECPSSAWGEPTAWLNDAGGVACFLSCDEDTDCPPQQYCETDEVDGDLLCYP